jgi:hypothetical protein
MLTSMERWVDAATSSTQRFANSTAGTVTGIEDGRGKRTTFSYDPDFEYLFSTSNALGQRRAFTYNGINANVAGSFMPGLLRTVADASDDVVTHEYNVFGRPTRNVAPDQSTITTSYEALGDSDDATRSHGGAARLVDDVLRQRLRSGRTISRNGSRSARHRSHSRP